MCCYTELTLSQQSRLHQLQSTVGLGVCLIYLLLCSLLLFLGNVCFSNWLEVKGSSGGEDPRHSQGFITCSCCSETFNLA